jgi:hypothetical protein
MGNLRRRIIEKSEEDPILIKLTNPGSYTQYSFLSGYKYVDMLICGEVDLEVITQEEVEEAEQYYTLKISC